MILLNNSLDALESSEVKWIEINVKDSNDKICIIVSDSGKKIEEKIANKIMEPFFTTKEVGKGAGLGLSISQGIIETHGGHFYLDQSALHTSFVIEIQKRN
jgi:C4-dicarboxylate-specific signal transduction histidine kinase